MPQSLEVAQVVSQAVPASLQTSAPGQGLGIPGSQVPEPLQAPRVSVLPLQLSQLVPAYALMQAPVSSQAAIPQAEPSVEHMLVQQLPVPSTPQICEKHWPFEEQGEPAGRLTVPLVVVPVVPEAPPLTWVPPQATEVARIIAPRQFHLATSHLRKRGDGNRRPDSRFWGVGYPVNVKFRERRQGAERSRV